MTTFYATTVCAIGPEAAALIDGGMLILFADGAPPELAEISVLHRPSAAPAPQPPPAGAQLRIGDITARLTAIGETAWRKIASMGHVVINFNGLSEAGRPGELCAEKVAPEKLIAALAPGVQIAITG